MKKIVGALVIVPVVGALYVGVGSIDADPPDVSAFTTTSTVPADEDNAWCGFVAATNAVKRWGDAGHRKLENLPPEEADALVLENADALAIFQESARRRRWYDKEARTTKELYLLPMSALVYMMNLYRTKCERQIARGEIGVAVEGVGDFFSLCCTMQADAESIVCWLLADGLRGMGMCVAAQIVASGKATDDELRALSAVLSSTDALMLRKSLQKTVDNEFAYVFGNSQRMIARLGAPKALPCEWKQILPMRFSFHPNRTTALYVKMAGRAKEMLSCDYDKSAWESFESEIEAVVTKKPRWFMPNSVGRLLFAMLAPAWNGIAKKVSSDEFAVSSAKVVVAVELYRRKTGRRPESLEALVPEFLPSVPVDPFDHGAPLKYDAERGIVWTVGPDRDFNGEKLSGKESYGRNRIYVVNLDGSRVN